MNHGSARTLVVVQRAVMLDDGAGGFTEQWSEVARFYGDVRLVGGSESLTAGGQQADMRWTIVTDYRLDIAEADQLVIQPDEVRVLEVISIRDPDLRRRRVDIDAVERRIDDDEMTPWRDTLKSPSRSKVWTRYSAR